MSNVIDFAKEKQRRDLKKRIAEFNFAPPTTHRINYAVDWMIDGDVNLVSIRNCFEFFFELFSDEKPRLVSWRFGRTEEGLAEISFATAPINTPANEQMKLSDWLVFHPFPEPPQGFNFKKIIEVIEKQCSR